MADEYVQVRNIEQFCPSYKDRQIIFAKLNFDFFSTGNPDFEMLHEVDKWRFAMFVILQLQTKKPVPINERYLTRKGFDLTVRDITLSIKELHNFLDVVPTAEFAVTDAQIAVTDAEIAVTGNPQTCPLTKNEKEELEREKNEKTFVSSNHPPTDTNKERLEAQLQWMKFGDGLIEAMGRLTDPKARIPWTRSDSTTFKRIFDYHYSRTTPKQWPQRMADLFVIAHRSKNKDKPRAYFTSEEKRIYRSGTVKTKTTETP